MSGDLRAELRRDVADVLRTADRMAPPDSEPTTSATVAVGTREASEAASGPHRAAQPVTPPGAGGEAAEHARRAALLLTRLEAGRLDPTDALQAIAHHLAEATRLCSERWEALPDGA